ncbi:MAG: KOW domain-containing RNA-binding protein [Defluviitaleaceae bacterium]|nr:KOW domain-containing RNA-binding protein [Defluviitaleaceae bacterium]
MTPGLVVRSANCSPMQPGQIVFSKAGRDKGLAMVILEVKGEYLYLADGTTRSLQKPKKKKAKHVQPTNHILELLPACGRDLQDADIRKGLKNVGF